MKSKLILLLSLSLLLLFSNCKSSIDPKNFDFEKHISQNDDLLKELERWDVDSAYIQLIGFPPSFDSKYYNENKFDNGLSLYEKYTSDFFDKFDIDQPVVVVWALRKNTYSGNSFSERGLSSSDLVDYENGVGRRDARDIHSLGDYTNTTYEYTDFYLGSYDGKFKMLSEGYNDDRDCIEFYNDLLFFNKELSKEAVMSTNKVVLYVKGKGFQLVNSDRLNCIMYNKRIEISPPFSEEVISSFNVQVDSKLLGSEYSVKDFYGKEILTGNLSSETWNEILVDSLPGGKYIFNVGKFYSKSFSKKAPEMLYDSVAPAAAENVEEY